VHAYALAPRRAVPVVLARDRDALVPFCHTTGAGKVAAVEACASHLGDRADGVDTRLVRAEVEGLPTPTRIDPEDLTRVSSITGALLVVLGSM
jgi:hypothetical protein